MKMDRSIIDWKRLMQIPLYNKTIVKRDEDFKVPSKGTDAELCFVGFTDDEIVIAATCNKVTSKEVYISKSFSKSALKQAWARKIYLHEIPEFKLYMMECMKDLLEKLENR